MKKFRCDDAGENKQFEKWVEKSSFNVDFEFIGANTPQHNGVVERGFATLTGRLRAMMKQAELSEELKYKLWAECAKTATDLDGLLISKKGEKSSFEKFFKDQPKLTSNLHYFGEIGIVLAKKKSNLSWQIVNFWLFLWATRRIMQEIFLRCSTPRHLKCH